MNPTMQVSIRIASDEDARRISAVLVALGYAVVRDTTEVSPPSRIAWAAGEIAARYRLSEHERDRVQDLLAGLSLADIAAKHEISRATMKWHMHNIYTKTGVSSLHALLLLGLRTLAGEDVVKRED